MAGNQAQRLSVEEFWRRFGQDESSSVDFKEQFARASKLQEPLVAFANARGGSILVGVGKGRPRRIVGTSWGEQEAERVQEAARATQPPSSVTTEVMDVDGRLVVVVQVDPVDSGWLQTSDGRVLVRAGPTNRALVGQELLRFLRERSSEPVEDEPLRRVTLQDLQQDALRDYLCERLNKQRVQLDSDARKLGLLTPDGRVRLAALLVFGRQPQRDNRRFGITVTRFEGGFDRDARLRDRRELRGPLPELVQEADQLVYEEMRKDAVIRGLVREEVPEFPPEALREALVNAVGHRDYSLRGSAIEVRLYDDAVEVESPGTLAGYVTVENLREAQYSRNERVMELLQRLRMAEEAGTGIDRIFTAMENALLEPPVFLERSASFVVRLLGRSVFAAEDRLWINQLSTLNLPAEGKLALVFARRHGAVSNEAVRSLRPLDERASRQVLQDLVARGLLAQMGRGRGTRYVLGERALKLDRGPRLDDQLGAILNHARRQGSVANRDVRGLLGVERSAALELLEALVAEGALDAVGERRARRYYPRDPGRP
jgi:ATP-dependent DNA helicase RecG